MAEQIVEEWLNRQGFFTIRGARVRNCEMDLLAIRPSENGMECWHYEVQASLRPVSYICAASAAQRREGVAPHSAKRRQKSDMQAAVLEWVQRKFTNDHVKAARQRLYEGAWQMALVVGNVKFDEEQEAIRQAGIPIIQLADIVAALDPGKSARQCLDHRLKSAGGTDLVELVWARQSLAKKTRKSTR